VSDEKKPVSDEKLLMKMIKKAMVKAILEKETTRIGTTVGVRIIVIPDELDVISTSRPREETRA
jgi:hypothetical protein